MNIKVDFDNIVVKEDTNDTTVKILMLKGEKGDQGDGENNVIEEVQVNGTALPVSNKAVNVIVPTVDSAISSTSENPVQNKVIYNALGNKVNNSDLSNYYQISEVDNLLNSKADTSDLDNYYTKTVADGLLNNKASTSDVGNVSNLTTTDKTSVVNAVNELNAPQKWVSVGTTAPTDSRKVWFKFSNNLFDIENAYHGTINAQGTEGTNESFRTTQYIPTTPASKYYFSTTQISGQSSRQIYIAYYDSSKTFVSRTSYQSLEGSFTTPANCYYMRAGVGSAWQENIMLNIGTSALPYEIYVPTAIYVNGVKIYEMT